MHAVVTIGEAILGFIVAIIISLVIGILMDFVSIIKMSLSYYVGYTDDTYNNYSTTFYDMVWIWNNAKSIDGNAYLFFLY